MKQKVQSLIQKINPKSPKFIILLGIILVVPLVLLISSFSQKRSYSKPQPQWQSYQEQIKTGKIKPAGKILEINLGYSSITGQLTVKQLNKKNGYSPGFIRGDNNYQIKLLNSKQNILAKQYFTIPNNLRAEDFDKDGTIHGSDVLLTNLSFAVTMPWIDEASEIRVFDKTGKPVLTSKLSSVNNINNIPKFSSIKGDEFIEMKKNKLNFNFLENIAYAQRDNGKVDMVFLGDGYSDMNAFRADANRYINTLTLYDPFKSRSSQLSFHIVENTDDLKCQSNGSRAIYCDESLVTQRVNSAGVPNDVITVIINSSESKAATTNIAYVTNATDDNVMVHEMGHVLGKLMDEYAYAGEAADGIIDNQIYKVGYFDLSTKRYYPTPGDGNCYAGNPPASAWNGLVNDSDYKKGCSFLNWYASSQTSVMRAIESGSFFFNTVSQGILNRRMDIIVKGGNPNISESGDLYAINRNGASGKTEVHTLTGASKFKDFSIHAATGLDKSVGNTWSFAVGGFYDDDSIPDIYAINRSGASGKTEVHVLSGKSNFTDFALHAATGLEPTTGENWVFDVGYGPDDDPRADLFAINKQGASGKTEVHILQGGTGKDYGDFSLHVESGLHATDKNWDFVVGDFSNSGKGASDVYAINKRGASGKTDVHVLSGASNYSDFSIHAVTALEPTDDPKWSFTTGYYDNDSRADLYAINRNGASGKTEVHILSAASNFSEFIEHAASGLESTNNVNWTFPPSQDFGSSAAPKPTDPVNPTQPINPTAGPTNGPIITNAPTDKPVEPTKPAQPFPTFVCGGSKDSICNPTGTITPRPTNGPNQMITQAPGVTGEPIVTPAITPAPDNDCLDPRSTPEKIQDWVNGFLNKINDYIKSIMGNPQNPNRPAPPVPCINR